MFQFLSTFRPANLHQRRSQIHDFLTSKFVNYGIIGNPRFPFQSLQTDRTYWSPTSWPALLDIAIGCLGQWGYYFISSQTSEMLLSATSGKNEAQNSPLIYHDVIFQTLFSVSPSRCREHALDWRIFCLKSYSTT